EMREAHARCSGDLEQGFHHVEAFFMGALRSLTLVLGAEATGHARVLRHRLTLAVATRQQSTGKWAPRDHADAVLLTGGQHRTLDAAHEDGVRGLLAHVALAVTALRHPLRFDDPFRRPRGVPEVSDLPLVHEIGERAERLVEVGEVFRTVD